MAMPGRGGFATLGGWGSGGTTAEGLPNSLMVGSRTGNDPLEYKAGESIEFTHGFESGEGDAFEAYITNVNGTSNNSSSNNTGEGLYRYGFNGKENDNEVKGEGGQQDYGMRIYDPRLGRFLSVDPLFKEYSMFSSYQFAGNRPIIAIDLEGLEPQEHPYMLKAIGKSYLSVTTEGNTLEAYQVNSPSFGKAWVAKISQKVGTLNGFELKPIEHFMYHTAEGGWQPWQKGHEPSIRLRQINQVADGIGIGFFGIAVGGTSVPAVSYMAPTLIQIGQIGLKATKWVGKNFGLSLLKETSKELLANRGNVSEMDWFDVGMNTITSRFKLGFAGNLALNTVNSSVDINSAEGATSIFTNNKSFQKAGFDMLFELPKIGINSTFDAFGGNKDLQKSFIDISVDQVKKSTEQEIRNINNGKDL